MVECIKGGEGVRGELSSFGMQGLLGKYFHENPTNPWSGPKSWLITAAIVTAGMQGQRMRLLCPLQTWCVRTKLEAEV